MKIFNRSLLAAIVVANAGVMFTGAPSYAEVRCAAVFKTAAQRNQIIEDLTAKASKEGLNALTKDERATLHYAFMGLEVRGMRGTFMEESTNHEMAPAQEGVVFSPNAKWRELVTNVAPGSTLAKTTKKQESELRRTLKSGTSEIIIDGNAAQMQPLFFDKATVTQTRPAGAYGSHISPQYEVSNVASSAVNANGEATVHIALTLTTSGHDTGYNANMPEAQQVLEEQKRLARIFGWSLNDKYSVELTDANNRVLARPVVNAPSRDVTTIQELDVVLKPGQTYKLKYQRGGSMGADAYAEWRVLEIKWDGTTGK